MRLLSRLCACMKTSSERGLPRTPTIETVWWDWRVRGNTMSGSRVSAKTSPVLTTAFELSWRDWQDLTETGWPGWAENILLNKNIELFSHFKNIIILDWKILRHRPQNVCFIYKHRNKIITLNLNVCFLRSMPSMLNWLLLWDASGMWCTRWGLTPRASTPSPTRSQSSTSCSASRSSV